jgi:hypothetical protein
MQMKVQHSYWLLKDMMFGLAIKEAPDIAECMKNSTQILTQGSILIFLGKKWEITTYPLK